MCKNLACLDAKFVMCCANKIQVAEPKSHHRVNRP